MEALIQAVDHYEIDEKLLMVFKIAADYCRVADRQDFSTSCAHQTVPANTEEIAGQSRRG